MKPSLSSPRLAQPEWQSVPLAGASRSRSRMGLRDSDSADAGEPGDTDDRDAHDARELRLPAAPVRLSDEALPLSSTAVTALPGPAAAVTGTAPQVAAAALPNLNWRCSICQPACAVC